MKLCGTSPDGRIVEMIEIPDHPWFLATQAHREFESRPTVHIRYSKVLWKFAVREQHEINFKRKS